MSTLRLIVATLLYHRRVQWTVVAGVAAATAVITGALMVGDSMRGSLRDLTLDRLGHVDAAMVSGHFFRAKLADELAAADPFREEYVAAAPAILLRGSVEAPQANARANRVNLIGCGPGFWGMFDGPPNKPPEGREVVLNEPLARQLGVKTGDAVIVRLPRLSAIPADSPLGRKRETVSGHRVTVREVIAAEGRGRFDLRPNQQAPRIAYLSLDWLQEQLGRPDRANVILVAGRDPNVAPQPQGEGALAQSLRPKFEDFGLRLDKTPRGYVNLSSDRMLLEPAAETALTKALEGQQVQPALTYLANAIQCRGHEIPYSTIAAVDFAAGAPLGPLVDLAGKPFGPLGDDNIVLNQWAADDLGARPGDMIRVTYFEPESADGQTRERTAEFRLVGVTPLAGAADDPAFTPDVPGVTDQASIADWDPPFPFDSRRIRKQDDRYWHDHRATPKAFVSLAAGRKLWASRFGRTTTLRVRPGPEVTEARMESRLAADPAAMGLAFQPVKRQGLEAAVGATSFRDLFLGFSFFILVAAVMLVALLFRLAMESRASQIGLLGAVGWSRRRVTGLLAAEGLLVAALGSLMGVLAGLGYAALMLAGLQTWWVAAIVTPFLRLHVTVASLGIGLAIGLGVAFAVMLLSLRRIARAAPRELLGGQVGPACRTGPSDALRTSSGPARQTARAWLGRLLGALPVAMLLGAVAMGWMGMSEGGEAQAGAFFGAGALVLMAALIWVLRRLRRGATGSAVAVGRGNLLRMALRNAARHPGRSTLTVGLVASASFLIVAVSAFRLDPASMRPERTNGTGGFTLLAESDQPLYHDLDTPAGREELGFSEDDDAALAGSQIFALRDRPGDDASCLNLYQPRQPRILGLPPALIARGGFAFTQPPPSSWRALNAELDDADGTPRVPAILDEATALYSLHLDGVGSTVDVRDGQGRPLRLEVVGLLDNSIFQGALLIGERAFQQHFPEISGFRSFLIESPGEKTAAVQRVLERTLGDYGFSAVPTQQRLAALMAVQNTYLSTFQTLGGLGLLLGTFGLAAVQARNVLERRRELALLRAVGFRRRWLAALVLCENGALLTAGLASGVLAALAAILPHLLAGGASIPWLSLGGTLLAVLLVGLLAGWIAARSTLSSPLLAALRNE